MGEAKISEPGKPKPGEGKEEKETVEKTGEPDYSKELEKAKSSISGIRTEVKDISERLSKLAEEKGVKEVLSECPECGTMIKPERMNEHLRNELEPMIRDELEPKIRSELEEKLEPEVKVKEVPKLIPQSEFRKTISDTLDERKKSEVDRLKPGIFEVEKILSNAGLIKSEGEE